MKSWDIKIAGEPYVLAGPGIELGGIPKEPAVPGQLGTILIPTFHAGLGSARDLNPGRYVSASKALLHKPGLVLPEYERPAAITSWARETPLYPWMLASGAGGPEDVVFVVGPKKLYYIDPHVDTPAVTEVDGSNLGTLTGDKRYTGSCFPCNNDWIFGFEDDTKTAAGFALLSNVPPSLVFDASSDKGGSGSSFTWNHVIGGGANRLLMVGVSHKSQSGQTVSGVTYNGVALTKLVEINNATEGRVSIWYLKQASLPGAGTYAVVVTLSASDTATCGAGTWSGVHQTTTFGTTATGTATGAKTVSIAVPSAVGEEVFDTVFHSVASGVTPGAGQTQRWGAQVGNGSTKPGIAGSTEMRWNCPTNVNWAHAGVAIKANTPGSAISAALTSDVAKGVSFGAARRGRIFWTRNKGIGKAAELYWSPTTTVDFESGGFARYGPINTDPILTTWVTLWGGTLFVSRVDGSVLGSEESGFVGLALPPPVDRDMSPSNAMLVASPGRGATPFLNQLLLPMVETVWGLNPHTLVARPMDPATIQDTDADFARSIFLAVAAVGPHAFLGGLTLLKADGTGSYVGRIYRLAASEQGLAAHAFGTDFAADERVLSLLPTVRIDQDRDPTTYLYVLTDDGSDVRLYRQTLRSDVNPAGAKPTPTVGTPVIVTPPVMSGDEAQRSMSKFFLQVRGRATLPAGGTPKVAFPNAKVDGNAVTIADVTSSGEFATPITAATQAFLIGRSVQFDVELHGTSAGKALHLPLSVDFLWVPAAHDYLAIHVLASGETGSRLSGVWNRSSGKAVVDTLTALRNTIVTAEFPEGVTGAGAQGTVSWTLFVERVDVVRNRDETKFGAGEYIVTLTCRKL